MSPYIKDVSLRTVLAAADIVEVVSGYVALQKRGSTYLGLCPFHQEKTPSFTVSPDKGLYYCFGCGQGGDVVTFLKEKENLSFVEAVEKLADRFSVALEYEEGGAVGDEQRSRRRRLLELTSKAADFYQRYLIDSREGAVARAYLEKRDLGSEVCVEFRVGYSPDDWQGLRRRALRDGFTERDLEDAGLIVRQAARSYDRFRGRLMFPLVDHRGEVVGFGGRTLKDESPKYLNSPEGPLYQKGRLLYGLFQARRAVGEAGVVLVVEGYTDLLALVQAGIRNVVASMGTALTEAQLELVARFSTNVVLMFDPDTAGRNAILRSGVLARRMGLHPTVAVLPQGSDPADFVRSQGAEAAKSLVADRISLLRFEIQGVFDQSDLSTSEGRIRAFEQIREILSRVGSPKEREEEIATIADRLRLSTESVALLLRGPEAAEHERGSRAGGRRFATARKADGGGEDGFEAVPGLALPSSSYLERVLASENLVELEFLAAAVGNLAVAGPLLDALSPEHFVHPIHRAAFLGLREAASAEDPIEVLKRRAQEKREVRPIFVRLAMEADQGRYGPAVLNELHLRLQDQYLSRRIANLRQGLEAKDANVDNERTIYRLELLRQQVRTMLTNVEEG